MSAEEATDQILRAEKVDLATAEVLKKSFRSTSEALKASKILEDIGSGGEDSFDPIGGGVAAEVSRMANELHKSTGGSGMKKSDAVLAAIHGIGGRRYEAYRKEFNHRARTL
jgi:hypothetical protein